MLHLVAIFRANGTGAPLYKKTPAKAGENRGGMELSLEQRVMVSLCSRVYQSRDRLPGVST